MRRNNLDLTETIFALATGRLPSAVAIEKISGPDAFTIAHQLFKTTDGKPFVNNRGMYFGILVDQQGRRFDEVMALVFVGPRSHSGENTVEFHCHGSTAVILQLETLLLDAGARPAEKGEFSYRAFLNGKMSKEQLDTLSDVFLARDSLDLNRIYSRLDGSLNEQINRVRVSIIKLQAIFDTAVDFSDEYSSVIELASSNLKVVIHECSLITHRYERFRGGTKSPRLVLAGRPNAGKSSLFNSLLGRYRAIVHDEPGTTKDVIEEDIVLGGRLWKLVDTAGVRSGVTDPEKQGIEIGANFLSASSCWVLVVDGSMGLSEAETALIRDFGTKPYLVVWNKDDLPNWHPPENLKNPVFPISALTGHKMDLFWAALVETAESIGGDSGAPLPSAVQAARLQMVSSELTVLMEELRKGVPPEFLAERNRHLLNALEGVVGEVGTEDVLDRVFSEFCIGK
jgi:tRNA modification GTPase